MLNHRCRALRVTKDRKLRFEDCCKATLKRPQPNYDHLLSEIDRRIGGEPTEEVKIPRGGTLTVKKVEQNIRGAEYYKNRLEK